MKSRAAFTTVELIVSIVLLSMALSSVLYMSKASRSHQVATLSASQQNAYATFQSEVTLQGINPSLVGNPLASVINQVGETGTSVSLGTNTTMTVSRGEQAAFEVGAVTQPTAAKRSLGGSATVDGINYTVTTAGAQNGGASAALGSGLGLSRGSGIGFGVETSGPKAAVSAIQLAPPIFNAFFNQARNDLTSAPFPLNDIATLPIQNPPGTTYRYTTDGSMPTASSPLWDNNPGWTPESFPAQVTLAAFNSDPQYATSVPVAAAFYMNLVITFGRADGRTANVYGFSLADLGAPAATGVVLTTNVAGFPVLYTLDGTDPTSDGATYASPFAPAQSQFSPDVPLNAIAVSTDPRIMTSSVAYFDLTTLTAPLSPPTYLTDNAAPLPSGTDVQLSVGAGGSPRTEVNNGAPSTGSSSATAFPIN